MSRLKRIRALRAGATEGIVNGRSAPRIQTTNNADLRRSAVENDRSTIESIPSVLQASGGEAL